MQKGGDHLQKIEKACELSGVAFLKQEHVRIMDLKQDRTFFSVLGVLLTKITVLAGIKEKIDDLNKQDISKMILKRYKTLSLNEIYFAFEKERYGEYEKKTSHFQLFNADYVSEILNKYKNWKRATKVEHNISAPLLQQENTISEQEKESIVAKGVERMYADYKEHKSVPIGCAYIYDYLLIKGEINKAEGPERTRILSIARKNLKSRNSTIQNAINALQSKGVSNVEIANECKRISLIEYFKNKQQNECKS